MTGTLQIIEQKSGNSYYYVKLCYKDPRKDGWRYKTLATGYPTKNNKRKAEAMIPVFIEKYSYLEELSANHNSAVNPDVTLCTYMDMWLKDKEIDLKQPTFEAYTYRVNRIKEYFLPTNPKLVDITPKMLDTYFKYCLKYGKTNQKTKEKEPLSVRSVRSYKSILYAVFNQALIDGLLKVNPTVGVNVHGKKNSDYSEELLFLTEEEIGDLLQFIAKYYPRLLGITFMGAYYGLRRSEILGLKWSAINFYKKTVSISHTVVRVKSTSACDTTKTTSSRRVLNLFSTAEKCLLKIKAEQEENRSFYGNTYKNHDGYIFTWEDGTLYDPNYISKLFEKATAEYGRPEITLHKLRHSCASMLINKGWDIKKLQYWLGHADTQTTLNIYAHFNRQRLNTSDNDLSEISLASANLFD